MIAPAKIAELEEQLPDIDIPEYTLADAIREGSTVTHQCVGNWVGPSGEMCALTASLLAVKARHLI